MLPERRVIQKPWLQTLVAHLLQQSLLHFFLTGDTMLRPRHGFQPLLLELFLAIRAHAVLVGLPDDWASRGIGQTRADLVHRAEAPVLLIRGSLRPGGLAPQESLTRYTWTLTNLEQ